LDIFLGVKQSPLVTTLNFPIS